MNMIINDWNLTHFDLKIPKMSRIRMQKVLEFYIIGPLTSLEFFTRTPFNINSIVIFWNQLFNIADKTRGEFLSTGQCVTFFILSVCEHSRSVFRVIIEFLATSRIPLLDTHTWAMTLTGEGARAKFFRRLTNHFKDVRSFSQSSAKKISSIEISILKYFDLFLVVLLWFTSKTMFYFFWTKWRFD